MSNSQIKRAVALALAGALAASVTSPALAAPVFSSTAIVKAAAPRTATDVRWYRGWHGGWGWRGGWGPGAAAGVGFAAGALLGAAAANSYYYDPDYYAPGPYYGYYAPPPVYAAPPAYYGPAYGPLYGPPGADKAQPCWVYTDKDRGFGYYRC